MEKEFFRVICIDESDPFEYKVLEDANRANLKEIHLFMDENFYKHIGNGIRWIVLPATVKI